MIDVVVAPVFHKYVPPAVAVKVVLCPLQMVVIPPMVGTGNGFTVTDIDAVPVHPLVVAVTLYVVGFIVGLTVIVVAVPPVFQLYVPPPVPVKVVLLPLQIVVVPIIVGLGGVIILT